MQTVSQWATTSYFYPRSPRGERRQQSRNASGGGGISIHAPREGSDFSRPDKGPLREYISIHAPREGSDHLIPGDRHLRGPISIHAPREGSDTVSYNAGLKNSSFLSTLPARGATLS